MAAPSKTFTAIIDGQIDADSPLDTTLLTQIRDNLVHLEEWLGFSYAAAQDHDHDNVNSKLIVTMAAAAVAQSQLKTATGAVSTSAISFTNLTLPGGTYGFSPQVKVDGNTGEAQISTGFSFTTYRTNIGLLNRSGAGALTFAQQRYVQASPPYKIGGATWGHFLFLLRKITTGDIVAAYEAEDPPWAYNGLTHLPKDDVNRIQEVPHPFADYATKDPATDGLEIALIDLSAKNTKKWKADNAKIGKSLIEDIKGIMPGKGVRKTFASKGIPSIPNFTDRVTVVEE